MKILRRLRAFITGSRIANVLQVLALAIGVFVIFWFLGWVWALVGVAVAFIIISLAIDGGSK